MAWSPSPTVKLEEPILNHLNVPSCEQANKRTYECLLHARSHSVLWLCPPCHRFSLHPSARLVTTLASGASCLRAVCAATREGAGYDVYSYEEYVREEGQKGREERTLTPHFSLLTPLWIRRVRLVTNEREAAGSIFFRGTGSCALSTLTGMKAGVIRPAGGVPCA